MKKLGLVITLSLFLFQAFAQDSETNRMILRDDWQMQSSLKVTDNGNAISQSKYQPQGWYKVSVPTTIIGGLLANKVYDFDPFMGMNFKKLDDPALDKPWWFRK
ncbi:MAG TPA: hypothetical protein VHS53_13270 [Mucilaginibacter sp.]|nr:hypothetical protein [Mucilaginibacter sp.]